MDVPPGRIRRNPFHGISAGFDECSGRGDSGRGDDLIFDMTGKHFHVIQHFPAVLDYLRDNQKSGQTGDGECTRLDSHPPAFIDRTEFRDFEPAVFKRIQKNRFLMIADTPWIRGVVPFVISDETVEPIPDFLGRSADVVEDDSV